MKRIIVIVFYLISIQQICFGQSNKWQFIKETNGVKVFYRETAGNPLKEVKIITSFKGSINSIISVLTDVNSYPLWVYGALESRVIKRISPSEMNYYNKLDFPWPLTDRDILIHTKIIKEGDIIYSISEATLEGLPRNENLVRISHFNSKWSFKPIGDSVEAEYVFSSDPGGNIPVWMVNLALDQGPLKTIQNFKIQLTKLTNRNDKKAAITK
ncbi:MAG: START domain-containing protein [Cytophagales bacterium]|nr:START domain-containing protein [Cytophagales bacterium]